MIPAVYAHRGASQEFPEQTLGAFRRAIEAGADGLECDVRLSSDGRLVCLHDSTVDRTSTGSGRPERLTLSEMRALDWGSWRDFEPPSDSTIPRDDGHRLVTLRELLTLATECGRPLAVAIEAKHPTPARGRLEAAIIAELDRFGNRRESAGIDARVISFSRTALWRMRRGAPGIPLAVLDGSGTWATRQGLAPRGVTILSPAIAVVRHHPRLVERAHERGLQVQVWTVDEPGDVELCRRLGVDALTTNRPAEVLRQLRG